MMFETVEQRRQRYLMSYTAKNAASKRALGAATRSLVDHVWRSSDQKITKYVAQQIAANLIDSLIGDVDEVVISEQINICRSKI